MANRNKKIDLNKVDSMIEDSDIKPLVSSEPGILKYIKVGDIIYIALPKYSQKTTLYREHQFTDGILTNEERAKGCLKLPDGLMMHMNKTEEVTATPDIKDLLKRGVLRCAGKRHKKRTLPLPEIKVVGKEEER